jgi:hypothetical protein
MRSIRGMSSARLLRVLAISVTVLACLITPLAANAAHHQERSGKAAAPPIALAGEAFGGSVSFHDKAASDTAWYDVPGMTLTFPRPGNYAVTTEVVGQVAALPNTAITLQQQLLVNGSEVPNSERFILVHGQAGTGGPSTWSVATVARTARHFITASGGERVRVQVRRLSVGATQHPGQPFTGITDTGVNRIEYVRLH